MNVWMVRKGTALTFPAFAAMIRWLRRQRDGHTTKRWKVAIVEIKARVRWLRSIVTATTTIAALAQARNSGPATSYF